MAMFEAIIAPVAKLLDKSSPTLRRATAPSSS